MSARHLTQARINALKPRNSVRNLRDGALKGFGVRVLPSGKKRFFIHSQKNGRRTWKIVGDADSISLDEARRRAADVLVAIRRHGEAPALPDETLFEAVAEEVFRNYGRNWKPRTTKVNRGYLRNQILPRFRGQKIADITRADVQRWFMSLHPTPVAADRSAPVLSVIMSQAEVYGYRPEGSNPCAGIRRYRRKGRERFLSEAELRRLALVLERHEARRPVHVAFIMLLLLTGCRKGELAALEWSSYREGHLFLRDSKTGPRTVWLSSPARAVLEQLPRTGNWVFSSAQADKARCPWTFEVFWREVRSEAGQCAFIPYRRAAVAAAQVTAASCETVHTLPSVIAVAMRCATRAALSRKQTQQRNREDSCLAWWATGRIRRFPLVSGCVEPRINGAQRREFVAITGTDDDSERWVGV